MKLMQNGTFRKFFAAFVLITIFSIIVIKSRLSPQTTSTDAELIMPTGVLAPQTIKIEDSPLKDSIIATGDFLVRQQLPNGEISYQVDILTEARDYSPSYIRL